MSPTTIIEKIWGNGLRGNLYKWIEDFLNERVHRLVVNGETSTWEKVDSGVLKDSVLIRTCVLFNIY